MTYKGYTIAILEDSKNTVIVEIRTKTIIMLGKKSNQLITRFVVDTRVENPIDSALEFIDNYTGGK